MGEDYYLNDVFRIFRDAGFGRKNGGNSSDGKLKFVLRILEEVNKSEPSKVSRVSIGVHIKAFLIFLHTYDHSGSQS